MEKECARLDAMHRAFQEYLDGRLSFAPLEESNPQAILELGSGSGLWAIEAAHQFPKAHVTAVDLQPIPRELPSNIEMRTLNLVDPLPFPEESFDIIHARAVFMHLPGAAKVLIHIIGLLKPGGWLVLDEQDIQFTGAGPATAQIVEALKDKMRTRGTTFGRITYAETCLAMGVFDEVHSKEVPLYISEQSDDVKLNRLGAAYRAAFLGAIDAIGCAKELLERGREEMNDRQCDTMATFVFTWARKKAI